MEEKIDSIGQAKNNTGKAGTRDKKYHKRIQQFRKQIEDSIKDGDDLLTMFYDGNNAISQEIAGEGAMGAPSTENIIEAMSVLGPRVVPLLNSDGTGSKENASNVLSSYDFDDILFERSFSTWPVEVSIALLALAYIEQEADLIEENHAGLEMEDNVEDMGKGDEEYEDMEGLRKMILERNGLASRSPS